MLNPREVQYLVARQALSRIPDPCQVTARERSGLGGDDDARGPRLLPVCAHRRPHRLRPGRLRTVPKIHRDESRTQGLDRLELIRFVQVAQTITVHHGALAYLLGINALRASEAAAVRIEDYADTLRGYRVLHLVGKGNKPATMPVTVPVLRVLEACRGQRVCGPADPAASLGPTDQPARRLPDGHQNRHGGRDPPAHQPPLAAARGDHQRLDAGVPLRDAQILARHADPRTTEHTTARGNFDRHAVHFLTAYVAGE